MDKYDYDKEMALPFIRRPTRVITPDMLGIGFDMEDARNAAYYLNKVGIRAQAREERPPTEGKMGYLPLVKAPVHIWNDMIEYVQNNDIKYAIIYIERNGKQYGSIIKCYEGETPLEKYKTEQEDFRRVAIEAGQKYDEPIIIDWSYVSKEEYMKEVDARLKTMMEIVQEILDEEKEEKK